MGYNGEIMESCLSIRWSTSFKLVYQPHRCIYIYSIFIHINTIVIDFKELSTP